MARVPQPGGRLIATLNPFDFAGPTFLAFYAALVAIAAAVTLLARRAARASPRDLGPAPQLDAYETAYLAGGADRVSLLAVASLVDQGKANLTQGPLGGVRFDGFVDPIAADHAIERAILSRRPRDARALRPVIDDACRPIRGALEAERLLAPASAATLFRATVVAAFGLTLLVGACKVYVGLARHRPVEFLVFACVATLMIGIAFFKAGTPFRTVVGDGLLGRLRAARPPERITYDAANGTLGVTTAASAAVALVGVAALDGHPSYSQFRRAFAPAQGSGGDSSSDSSGSSCGSSDSGGSSCGSGCGGCGGGGD